MEKINDTFLSFACGILAETNSGLSGTKIAERCNSYAIDFGREIPHNNYPFACKNKRTALLENLRVFAPDEQFQIIKELCELPLFNENQAAKKVKEQLYLKFGFLAEGSISKTELVLKTKHWLADYPDSLKQYENALIKYESGIFERNTLDDMRLSFEILVKSLLKNNRTLENQIADIGNMLKAAQAPAELRNMFTTLITYYTNYQNSYVKHNDKVNGIELEFIIELTSVIMKFLIKASGVNSNE